VTRVLVLLSHPQSISFAALHRQADTARGCRESQLPRQQFSRVHVLGKLPAAAELIDFLSRRCYFPDDGHKKRAPRAKPRFERKEGREKPSTSYG
jgi:hypothetical protein